MIPVQRAPALHKQHKTHIIPYPLHCEYCCHLQKKYTPSCLYINYACTPSVALSDFCFYMVYYHLAKHVSAASLCLISATAVLYLPPNRPPVHLPTSSGSASTTTTITTPGAAARCSSRGPQQQQRDRAATALASSLQEERQQQQGFAAKVAPKAGDPSEEEAKKAAAVVFVPEVGVLGCRPVQGGR